MSPFDTPEGPVMFDAASGFALDVLTTLVHALAPVDGGVAVLAGVAILTALVRLALHPLARRQAKAMQAQLDCRPSSVFGNKPCPRNGECMDRIPPAQVAGAVLRQLKSSRR